MTRHTPRHSRRALLASGAATLATLAGCLGGDDGDDDTDTPGTDGGEPSDDAAPGDDGSPDNSSDDTTGNGTDDDSSDDDDTGTDNGSDDDDSGDGEPADPPASTLLDLRVGQIPNAIDLGLGEDTPVSVTLVNDADATHEFTVDLAIAPSDFDIVYDIDSQSVTLEAGAQQRLTFEGATPGLPVGAYEVRASTRTAEATAELSVFGTTPVTIRVFTQSVAEDNVAEAGQLTVTDGTTELASTSLDGPGHPTVELPLGETDSVTAEVTNVNNGMFPDTSTTIDRASITHPTDEPTVDVVAGYPFKGEGNQRFITYIFEATNDNGLPEETFMYGSYADDGYHAYYIEGIATEGPSLSVDDTPPAYGADLYELREKYATGDPAHSLWAQPGLSGSKTFFHPGTRDRWELGDNAVGMGRKGHIAAAGGLDAITDLKPEWQQYVGTDTVRGIDVDVYEVSRYDATVYVDPDTGYTIRYETTSLGKDNPNSYEVVEFFDYGDHDTIDWELIKARSTHETGENLDGEELEQLPWEYAGVDE